jgi:hypothetical protein
VIAPGDPLRTATPQIRTRTRKRAGALGAPALVSLSSYPLNLSSYVVKMAGTRHADSRSRPLRSCFYTWPVAATSHLSCRDVAVGICPNMIRDAKKDGGLSATSALHSHGSRARATTSAKKRRSHPPHVWF